MMDVRRRNGWHFKGYIKASLSENREINFEVISNIKKHSRLHIPIYASANFYLLPKMLLLLEYPCQFLLFKYLFLYFPRLLSAHYMILSVCVNTRLNAYQQYLYIHGY